jgi:hypothetical protein
MPFGWHKAAQTGNFRWPSGETRDLQTGCWSGLDLKPEPPHRVIKLWMLGAARDPVRANYRLARANRLKARAAQYTRDGHQITRSLFSDR